jgi:hypothetical protein
MAKTQKIIFRVNSDLKEFMEEFARRRGMTISDLARSVLSYWFLSFYTGDLKINYDDLKSKFLNIMNEMDRKEQIGGLNGKETKQEEESQIR